jgi:hypothetical protein
MDKGPPAFKFVLVFIVLLLSQLLKAVRMPIANTPNSSAAESLESHCAEWRWMEVAAPLEPAEALSRPPADYPIG